MKMEIIYELYVPRKKKSTLQKDSQIVDVDNFEEDTIIKVCGEFESNFNDYLWRNFSDYFCSVKKIKKYLVESEN